MQIGENWFDFSNERCSREEALKHVQHSAPFAQMVEPAPKYKFANWHSVDRRAANEISKTGDYSDSANDFHENSSSSDVTRVF